MHQNHKGLGGVIGILLAEDLKGIKPRNTSSV
jgi:hypothetical protein